MTVSLPTGSPTSSWARVLSAREGPPAAARQALEGLCRVYWYPVYAFVRRQGNDAEDSRDLTQAYFAELLEKGYLSDYDPQRGRFRVFLMASVKHFLSKEREKALAWKRGGRADVVSLDAQEVDGRYRYEPVDRLTPEQIFERRWALTVLERARAPPPRAGGSRPGPGVREPRGLPDGRAGARVVPGGRGTARDDGGRGQDLDSPPAPAPRSARALGDRGDRDEPVRCG